MEIVFDGLKKFFKKSEEFDPMKLPVKAKNLILNNLTFKDLLEVSLVSKKWYVVIGNSENFKDKVEINCFGRNNSKDPVKNVTAIKNSSRKYESVFISAHEFGIEKELLKAKEWNYVTINIEKFYKKSDYINYLELVAGTVCKLKIHNSQFQFNNTGNSLVFPCLESLEFSNASIEALDPFLKKHQRLTSLSIICLKDMHLNHSQEGRITKSMTELLELNCNLEHLELHLRVTSKIFIQDITKITKFKLRTLIIRDDRKLNQEITTERISKNIQINLEKFLKVQGEYLMELTYEFNDSLEVSDFNLIYNTWNEMKLLENLSFNFLKTRTDFYLNTQIIQPLEIKESIKRIEIKSLGKREVPWEILQIILLATSNLETLLVSRLTKEVLEFIVKKLKNFKRLKYESVSEDCRCLLSGIMTRRMESQFRMELLTNKSIII
ncbi:unnamed protein product [Diamesa hyperborea]